MIPLTILVDMDDTVENLLEGWVSWLNAKYGLDVDWRTIRSWSLEPYFPTLTSEQLMEPFCIDEFWDWVKPIPYATEMLHQLRVDGHRVYIVTATTYETLPAKMDRVLFRYFPYLTFDDVIVTSNKQLIKGDVLIDDGVHNHIGGDYAKLLMDAPHNKDFDAEANGMKRVYNWQEIYNIITDMSKGG